MVEGDFFLDHLRPLLDIVTDILLSSLVVVHCGNCVLSVLLGTAESWVGLRLMTSLLESLRLISKRKTLF